MNGEQLRFDSTSPAHWRPAVRVDVGRLAHAEKTAVGYRVDAVIARAGVLEYVRADGSKLREYLPPERRAASTRSRRCVMRRSPSPIRAAGRAW